MELRDLAMGRRQPDPALRTIFTPAGGANQSPSDILATFKGFGRSGRGREAGLGLAERFGLISSEQRANAAAGIVGDAAEGAAAVGERAAFAGPAAGGGQAGAAAAAIVDQPAQGGSLYAQLLARQHGLQAPVVADDVAAATIGGGGAQGATAAAAEEIVERAAPLTDAVVAGEATGVVDDVAAVADDAAARMASLERRLVDGFQRIGQLPEEQRLGTIAEVLNRSAAAGHGDDAFQVLATSLAQRPLEHTVQTLDDVLDDVAARAATVADDVAHAAPLADDVARAATIADDVAKAAPIVDDVVAKAAPLADDVARGVAKSAPAAFQAVRPLADDALRHGLQGVMGFSAGIDDTLRLLAKIR